MDSESGVCSHGGLNWDLSCVILSFNKERCSWNKIWRGHGVAFRLAWSITSFKLIASVTRATMSLKCSRFHPLQSKKRSYAENLIQAEPASCPCPALYMATLFLGSTHGETYTSLLTLFPRYPELALITSSAARRSAGYLILGGSILQTRVSFLPASPTYSRMWFHP